MKIALLALAATVAVSGLAGTAEARPFHHRPVYHHHVVRHVYHHPVRHWHHPVHRRHH